MREILIFLESCPTEFKSDVASNIVSIAAKYAPNAQWHIDTILKVNIYSMLCHYCNVRDHRLHPLGLQYFQYCNQMFAFLQFVAIFSNTATKFQNISNFVQIWLQYWKILQQNVAKNLTFGFNIENTATEGCNRRSRTFK